jgi:hypothetical protein
VRQRAGAALADEGFEAHEVHGLLQALAYLVLDPGPEIMRAVGMAKGHGSAEHCP